jgi:hypothetical protein
VGSDLGWLLRVSRLLILLTVGLWLPTELVIVNKSFNE